MPVTPALRRLMRRMFPDRRASVCVAFRRDFAQLEQRLGPFDDVLVQYAAGVVMFALEFQTASADVQRAQAARTLGKGRRPTAGAIERLKRRQGLSWTSYTQSLHQLEELAKKSNRRRGARSFLSSLEESAS